MPATAIRPRASLNWEVLRRVGQRILAQRGQGFFTILGLSAPLAAGLITLLRPFNPRHLDRDLLQFELWLCAWYSVFTVFYVLAQWLRSRNKSQAASGSEAELALPLPPLQHFLHRCLELALLPLRNFALTLPLWLVVLIYIGLPYGRQWSESDTYSFNWELTGLWPAKLACIGLNLLAAVLLPLGLALLLQESLRAGWLRAIFLLLPPVAIYAAHHFYDEALRMPYRQTRGYDALSFVAPLLVLLLGTMLLGWLKPGWRIALLLLAAGVYSALGVVPALLDSYPRLGGRHFDAPFAARYLALHLAPTNNIRLILDSWTSNVVLQDKALTPEPQYPEDHSSAISEQLYALQDSGAEPGDPRIADLQQQLAQARAADQQAEDDYYKLEQAYETAQAGLPRLPMLYGAALLPLLLPLLCFTGLALGGTRQPDDKA